MCTSFTYSFLGMSCKKIVNLSLQKEQPMRSFYDKHLGWSNIKYVTVYFFRNIASSQTFM